MTDKTKRVALVGPPNVGKSALFHRWTGRYVAVSNYPGTTVDVTEGLDPRGDWSVVDTPGAYSLFPESDDERVTRDVLLTGTPDVVVQVLDAKNLRRGFSQTLELSLTSYPVVLALNMMDEARERGVRIDLPRLSERLGVPVIPTVATTGQGVPELIRAMALARPLTQINCWGPEFKKALEELEKLWKPENKSRRLSAAALLLGDTAVLPLTRKERGGDRDEERALERAQQLRAPWGPRLRWAWSDGTGREVNQWMSDWVEVLPQGTPPWLATLGQWSLRPFPGVFLALLALWGVYEFVGVFGAQWAVGVLENDFFGGWVVPGLSRWLQNWSPPLFTEFLVGPYGVVSMALSYALALILPIVTTFFIAFGLLEDSGYLPRLSVLLDRFFRLMGLNGRAVLPVLLGLGCDTMATITTRTLPTAKERMVVTFLLTLSIPCSAQLAVILGMTAGLSWKISVVWLTVLLGVTGVAGWAAARWIPGSTSAFVTEIPPLRWPILGNVFLKMRLRLWWYVKEVVPLFVAATALLFVADKAGWLEVFQRALSPVVNGFLGLPIEATPAFILGFLRRDYGAAGLFQLQREGLLDARQITVSLVLITLFMPCIAQWIMVARERGWKACAGLTLAVTGLALGVSAGLNFFLTRFPFIVGG